MSDLLKQVENIRESREKTKARPGHTTVNEHSGSTTPTEKQSNKQRSQTAAKKTESATNSFGGFQKGFLFGSNRKSSSKAKPITKDSSDSNKPPAVDDVPFIKPAAAEEPRWQMPEVQEAMKASQAFALNSKEWVTEDLLAKVTKNEVLVKRLADPHFMQALSEFQTNPTGAMQKYKDNEDVQHFLKEFCGIMGEHFTKLGAQQPEASPTKPPVSVATGEGADLSVHSSTSPNQPTAADERRMQEILSDPATREVLMDPQIQQLLHTLRSQPDQAQSILARADKKLQQKIKRLVDVGLLQFQR